MRDYEAYMRITKADLSEAVSLGLLSPDRLDELEIFLAERSAYRLDRFGFVGLSYYLGAMIVISALTWFMVDSWNLIGGWGLAGIALAYGCLFVAAGNRFYRRRETEILGGLLIAISVCLVPLFTYGVQKALGYWPGSMPGDYIDLFHWGRSGWCLMEVTTILAGLVAVKYVRFPFLIAPVAFSVWFLSMDISSISGLDRGVTSLLFGMFMILSALWWDIRRENDDPDYGFWLHLFGALTFWGGLSSLDGRTEFRRIIYCLINCGLILFSIVVDRSVYLILGALGFFGYLGHLAWTVFSGTVYFPFLLVLFGLAVMGTGLWYHRNRPTVIGWLESRLPRSIMKIREVRGDSSGR